MSLVDLAKLVGLVCGARAERRSVGSRASIVVRGVTAGQGAVPEFGLNAFIVGTRNVDEVASHDGWSGPTYLRTQGLS